MAPRGKLITLEGIDGAGKTTLTRAMVSALPGLVALREPGGVQASERIRDLVKDPGLQIGARAEALLYAAARAQLVQERLGPLLEEGTSVLLDRYVDSSLVYQGAGRGLGVAEIAQLNQFATGGLVADRTLLLRIDASVSAARRSGDDRLEQEDEDFFVTIAAAYDALAAAEPGRIRVLDGSAPPADVLAAAIAAVEDLLRP